MKNCYKGTHNRVHFIIIFHDHICIFISGIAVDWLTENIYWTDALYHHIAVSRYDGQHRMIVIKKNVVKPRSIVVHPHER